MPTAAVQHNKIQSKKCQWHCSHFTVSYVVTRTYDLLARREFMVKAGYNRVLNVLLNNHIG